jgi:hypothetical protein
MNGCFNKAVIQFAHATRKDSSGKFVLSPEDIIKVRCLNKSHLLNFNHQFTSQTKLEAMKLLKKTCIDGSEDRSCYMVGGLLLDKGNHFLSLF